MSWQTGMVLRIESDRMHVKVPTGADCAACHGKMSCTFQGPDKACKTLEVPRLAGTAVGDKVLEADLGASRPDVVVRRRGLHV